MWDPGAPTHHFLWSLQGGYRYMYILLCRVPTHACSPHLRAVFQFERDHMYLVVMMLCSIYLVCANGTYKE